MKYGIVNVAAAPVRRKARHQSEMVNQLLFGEAVRVIKEKGDLWVKVRSLHDDYEGWMTNTLLADAGEKEGIGIAECFASGLVNELEMDGRALQIPFGSTLLHLQGDRGRLGGREYLYTGKRQLKAEAKPGAENLNRFVIPWLNAPYLWGGRTVMGVDCSGFVQVNFKMMGLDLPRDAWQQAQKGQTVKKLKEAACGDLVFFDDRDEIVHVGILLNNEQVIHASGRVRIDPIDKKGIINGDTGKRTHFLESIKRYW